MSKRLLYDEKWTTAEGIDMYVADMTEAHAKNCLRLMIKRTRDQAVEEVHERMTKYLDGCGVRWVND